MAQNRQDRKKRATRIVAFALAALMLLSVVTAMIFVR